MAAAALRTGEIGELRTVMWLTREENDEMTGDNDDEDDKVLTGKTTC